MRPEAAGGGAAPSLASVPSREECVICSESYSTSQARKLECGHQFHDLVSGRAVRPADPWSLATE